MFVYLISDHGEDGSEHVQASLDPAKVRPFVRQFQHHTATEAEIAACESLFDAYVKANRAVDGVGLTKGWGGVSLHIVELIG